MRGISFFFNRFSTVHIIYEGLRHVLVFITHAGSRSAAAGDGGGDGGVGVRLVVQRCNGASLLIDNASTWCEIGWGEKLATSCRSNPSLEHLHAKMKCNFSDGWWPGDSYVFNHDLSLADRRSCVFGCIRPSGGRTPRGTCSVAVAKCATPLSRALGGWHCTQVCCRYVRCATFCMSATCDLAIQHPAIDYVHFLFSLH